MVFAFLCVCLCMCVCMCVCVGKRRDRCIELCGSCYPRCYGCR